jgi:hypothetical protein
MVLTPAGLNLDPVNKKIYGQGKFNNNDFKREWDDKPRD